MLPTAVSRATVIRTIVVFFLYHNKQYNPPTLFLSAAPSKQKNLSEAVRQECQEWRQAFPHLHVQGHQTVPELETGVLVAKVIPFLLAFYLPLFFLRSAAPLFFPL